jgi:transposase
MNLCVEQKKLILQLSSEGLKARKIAELLMIHHSSVYRFLKRFKVSGSLERASTSGRPKKTDDRVDRRLFRLVKENRRKSIKEICALFKEENHVEISTRTVARRLKAVGFKKRVVKKKIVISDVNKNRRRGWCRSRLHLTVDNYWKNVIFSDETQIVIGKDNKVYVWRKDEEIYSPQCVGAHADPNPRCRLSVMFWGCVTFHGVGCLVPVDGTINSQRYVDVLDNHLWPVVDRYFENEAWIFQEDNAPCHTSKFTTQWKQQHNVPTMTWPSQSPDLNVIENVWRTLKVKLQRRLHEVRNRESLVRLVQEIWTSLSPAYIQSLYNTIPTRIRQVLRVGGSITKY